MYTQQDLLNVVLAKPVLSDRFTEILEDFTQHRLYVSGRDSIGQSVEDILWEKGLGFLVPRLLKAYAV